MVSQADNKGNQQGGLTEGRPLAVGLVALAFTRSLWQVWIVFATLLPVGNVLLGQLPTSTLITRWFFRFRGRALGIAAVGTSLGGFVFPVLLISPIESWRSSSSPQVNLGKDPLSQPREKGRHEHDGR